MDDICSHCGFDLSRVRELEQKLEAAEQAIRELCDPDGNAEPKLPEEAA